MLGPFLHTGVENIIYVVEDKRGTDPEKILSGTVSRCDHVHFLLELGGVALPQIPSHKKGHKNIAS